MTTRISAMAPGPHSSPEGRQPHFMLGDVVDLDHRSTGYTAGTFPKSWGPG